MRENYRGRRSSIEDTTTSDLKEKNKYPASMEKSSNVHSTHQSRPKMTPRKGSKREAVVTGRSHQQKASKSSRVPETPSTRKVKPQKEKPESNEVKREQETEVKLKPTVVDIDSVRDDEKKEENLGLLEAAAQEDALKSKNLGVFEWLLMIFILVLVLLFLPLSIWFCFKVVREHERAVIFRLGHLLRRRPRGPGLIFYLPFLDVCHKVDIRLKMLKVPLHTVVTKDLIRPELSVVCYYQIENVALCSTALSSLTTTMEALVQAAVREVLAKHTFNYVLLYRRKVGQQIQTTTDSVACHWGIRVERADIDEFNFPMRLQQDLAAEVKRQQQGNVKATERQPTEWDGFRQSFRHLHPALVLPFSPDFLSLTSDHSPLPPPPPPSPPSMDEEEAMTEEPETDSPMM